jgi:voltage-gated potassium channel
MACLRALWSQAVVGTAAGDHKPDGGSCVAASCAAGGCVAGSTVPGCWGCSRGPGRLRDDMGMIALLVRVLRTGHRRHVLILLCGVVVVTIAGGALFAATQHYPFTTGLYWAITTATTVGYGDVTPHNAAGRVVASVVMLTAIPMLAAAFALVTGAAAAAGVRRVLAMGRAFPPSGYRLVIGMDKAVHAILDELVRIGDPVVLVADVDPAAVRDEVHVVRGDPTEEAAIRAARPADAQQALITGTTDGDVLVSAVLLRKQAPDLPVVALVRSASVREALRDLGIQRTISAEGLVAHTLAMSLETPHAGDLLTQLVESDKHSLTETQAGADAVGKPLSAIRAERSGLVLGLVHDGGLLLGIGDDPVVTSGDRLLIAEPVSGRRRPGERVAAARRPGDGTPGAV